MPVIKSFGIPFFVTTLLLVTSAPVSAAVLGFTDIRIGSELGAVGIVETEYRDHGGGINRIHDYAHNSSVKNTDVEWSFLGEGAVPSFRQIADWAGYTSEFGMILDNKFWSFDHFVAKYGTDSTLKFHLGIVVSNRGRELYRWSSSSQENSDGLDHMVTWVVDVDAGIYAVAFEDLENGGDLDFNDLILEVRGFVDGPTVPEPATLTLLGFGLAGIGCYKRRRTKIAA